MLIRRIMGHTREVFHSYWHTNIVCTLLESVRKCTLATDLICVFQIKSYKHRLYILDMQIFG